ncbi:hypothetical protein [Microbacterium gorillae]|uniref:hypothetical protein n=1 Tax=Microbacterium gorillae TaxID=1231063 RepID=UPI0005916E8E|nr:hypothetical protein [Microbacterium gorillae]
MKRGEAPEPGDVRWTSDDARYRVFWQTAPDEPVQSMDIVGVDAAEAISDARDVFGRTGPLSLALVVDPPGGERGLVWLLGTDLAVSAPTRRQAEAQFRQRQDYLSARSHTLGPGEELRLPDGRRLLRFFPDHGGLPVWESFTENYPFTRAGLIALGVPEAMVADLAAWDDANRSFEDDWVDGADGRAWIAARIPLIRALRSVLPPDVILYAGGD